MFVIVPDTLPIAINEALDKAIADCPGAAVERGALYDQLFNYYVEHGVIPEFTLAPKEKV